MSSRPGDSLQLTDAHRVATPVTLRPYLRLTPQPGR